MHLSDVYKIPPIGVIAKFVFILANKNAQIREISFYEISSQMILP